MNPHTNVNGGAAMRNAGAERLRVLMFNLETDPHDPVLGFAVKWIELLAERHERVDVITMRSGEYQPPANVRVFSVGKEQGRGRVRRLASFYAILGGLLRRGSYDICFAHMMPVFALLAAPLLRIRRIPIVLWYAHKATPFSLRVAARCAAVVVTPSSESFRLRHPRVVITGHGIDTTELAAAAGERRSGAFNVLSVARLSHVKRPDIVIDAASCLKSADGKSGAPVKWRLVGPGEPAYIDRLKTRARERGVSDDVEFAGPIEHANVAREYAQTDVAVNVSETGSLDKAVLEAMSCGVPVVTSNEGCIEILRPVSEMLVSEHHPQAVADRVRALRALPATDRRELGRRLRDVVKRDHDLHVLMSKLHTVFQQTRRKR